MTPEEVVQKERLKVVVSTVILLKHIDANTAVPQLRPFFAASGGAGPAIGSAGNPQSLLLTGFADQVAGVVRLLRAVDLPERESGASNYLHAQLARLSEANGKCWKELTAVRERLALLEAQVADYKKKE
jgi:hypothetical protein